MNSAGLPRLVERKELARRDIFRSAVTLWRWEKAGRLKPIRIANRIYYDEDEINALLAEGEPAPPPPPGRRVAAA